MTDTVCPHCRESVSAEDLLVDAWCYVCADQRVFGLDGCCTRCGTPEGETEIDECPWCGNAIADGDAWCHNCHEFVQP